MENKIPTAEETRLKYIPNGCVNIKGKGLGDGKPQKKYEDKIKQIKEQRDKEIADSNTQEIIDETAHKQKIAKINADADKKLRDAGKATTDELAQYNLNKIKSTAETVNQFIQSSLDYR